MKVDFQAFWATGIPITVLAVSACIVAGYVAIKIILKLDIPYRLAQFLEWINSKTSHYYGIILAVLAGNALSSVRAGGVYYIFFHVALEQQLIFGIPFLLWTICGVATLVVFFCGYYVAIHRPKRAEWLAFILICLIFVAHDFAGIMITESINNAGKNSVEINTENWAGWAFCALSLVPLLLGRWLPVLEKEKKSEEDERHVNFAKHLKRKTEVHAIKVLASTATQIPDENVWMFLPENDQAIGKKILEIANGTYQGSLPTPKGRPAPQLERNTGPIMPQLTGPMPIDAEIEAEDQLPYTPLPMDQEDLEEEEVEVTSGDMEEESFGEAIGNFMKSVRESAGMIQKTILKH